MRRKLLKLTCMCFALFLSLGCGKKEATKTDFNISLGGLVTGTPMDGGIYLWAIGYDEDGNQTETLMIDLDANDSAVIPVGSWEFHLDGYLGPSAWQGTNYCGSIPQTLLETPDINLPITINTSNCISEPYVSMIAAKASATAGSSLATWDNAIWDSGIWGP